MTRETFSITVEVLDCAKSETAIATAAGYLAYADLTDTIGYAPNISDVHTVGDESGPTAVTITTTVTIQDDDHLKRFMDELANMSKVVSVERGE